jgi:hypothetical protein
VLTYRPETPEQVRGLGLHTEIMRVFASLPFVFDVLCCRFRSCTTAASTFLTACLAWKAPTLTVSSIWSLVSCLLVRSSTDPLLVVFGQFLWRCTLSASNVLFLTPATARPANRDVWEVVQNHQIFVDALNVSTVLQLAGGVSALQSNTSIMQLVSDSWFWETHCLGSSSFIASSLLVEHSCTKPHCLFLVRKWRLSSFLLSYWWGDLPSLPLRTSVELWRGIPAAMLVSGWAGEAQDIQCLFARASSCVT